MTESGSWHLVPRGGGSPFVVFRDAIVGRSAQAQLRIDEGYVSRRHARLWIEAGRLMVEDLGSANGTFLNGERLAGSQCLLPGDRISFDQTEFQVRSPANPGADATAHRPPGAASAAAGRPEPAAAPAPSPWRRQTSPPREPDFDLDDRAFDLTGHGQGLAAPPPATAFTAPARSDTAHWDTQADFDLGLDGKADLELSIGDARPEAASPQEAFASSPVGGGGTVVMRPEDAPGPPALEASGPAPGLLFLTGPEEGALYRLAEGRVRIGRAPGSDIRIEEASVSKRHAELLVRADACRIHDVSNSNGIYVNGRPIDDAALAPGDVIRLGRVEFLFDAYDRLAEGGGADGIPWGALFGGFLGTAGLALLAYVALRLI